MKTTTKYWDDNMELHRNAQLDLESVLALKLIEHWGLIAGKPSGKEDSAGRAILALQTPEELVERAFITAGLFIAEAEKRDGIKPLPPMKERIDIMAEMQCARFDAAFDRRHENARPANEEPVQAQTQPD